MKLTVAITAAAFGVTCAAQGLNDVVVTVNGDKVLANEYFNRMEFLQGVGISANGKFVEIPPALLTLERLINERFILQLAKEKGVAPSVAEIDAEYKKRQAENPDHFKRLLEIGISEAEVKPQIAVELAQFKLVTQGVNITDQQVTEHYNTNKAMYTRPGSVKLRVIVVKTLDDKAKVDEALKTRAFPDVAREMSTDLTKLTGGDLPEVFVETLPPTALEPIKKAAAGQTTDWVESEGAFLKYFVERKEDAKQIPLDDKLKAEIKRRMMLIAGQQKNDLQAMIAEKRKAAKIEMGSPGLQKLWEAYSRPSSIP